MAPHSSFFPVRRQLENKMQITCDTRVETMLAVNCVASLLLPCLAEFLFLSSFRSLSTHPSCQVEQENGRLLIHRPFVLFFPSVHEQALYNLLKSCWILIIHNIYHFNSSHEGSHQSNVISIKLRQQNGRLFLLLFCF